MADISIVQKAIELSQAGRSFALASVIRSAGSTPQKAGANAIFAADGAIWGTLGGGCLEAECRRRALDGLDAGEAMAFDLRLDDIQGWDDGLICGGKVRVFIDPRPQRNQAVYESLVMRWGKGEPVCLLTVVGSSDPDLGVARVCGLNEVSGELGGELSGLKALIETQRAGCVDGSVGDGKKSIYFEPFVPKPRLVIAGAGHIGKATAHLGHLMGFEVIVIDDRPSLVSKENIPEADRTLCGDIPEEMAKLETHEQTYIVIVTRGHRHDGTVLAKAVKKPAAFVGMIGSRRKGLMIREGLVEEGLATPEELERVCSPIGVDIGAESVPEIALSIMTQLVAVRRKRSWSAPAMNYGLEDYRDRPRGGTLQSDGATEVAPPMGG